VLRALLYKAAEKRANAAHSGKPAPAPIAHASDAIGLPACISAYAAKEGSKLTPDALLAHVRVAAVTRSMP
jgi:hypothetical protein